MDYGGLLERGVGWRYRRGESERRILLMAASFDEKLVDRGERRRMQPYLTYLGTDA